MISHYPKSKRKIEKKKSFKENKNEETVEYFIENELTMTTEQIHEMKKK